MLLTFEADGCKLCLARSIGRCFNSIGHAMRATSTFARYVSAPEIHDFKLCIIRAVGTSFEVCVLVALIFDFLYSFSRNSYIVFAMGDLGQESFKHEAPIVIVGGGPVGMLTAFELSRLGIECLLAEQSLETTKWPKMDLTNCRSMEIMRMMGIADEYRAQMGSVAGHCDLDSLFYTSCCPGGELMTAWVPEYFFKLQA